MSWHYACKKVKAEFGDEYEYTVVEVFPDLKKDTDDVVPHTENTTFFGESPEDLLEWLHAAAADIQIYGCINEDDL